jgi:Viral BACON domain
MIANDSPYGFTFFTFDPVNGTLPSQLIPDMKSLGLTWIRYQLPWPFIEQHQGIYTWTALDNVVATCNSNNINICYVIQQSPQFYDQQPGYNSRSIISGGLTNSTSVVLNSIPTELPPSIPVRLSGGTGNPEIVLTSSYYSTGANPVTLASPITGNNRTTMQWYLYPDPQSTKVFAQAVATRYNGQNGHGMIQAFEIGNEEYDSQNPNGTSANAYNDRAASYYINVLPVVAPAIRAASPNALVGMCAIWWNQLPHVPNFLSAIYQASPTMKNNFDYVNFHYYPFESGSSDMVDVDRWCYGAQPQSTIPSFTQEWQALQTVMNANGDGSKTIWVTEFGWYTTNSQPYRGTVNMVSQDIQSRNYFSFYESARLSGVVSHAFFWTLDYAPSNAAINRDGTVGPGVPAGGYPISDAYSLVQVQYVNGKPTTNYTSAFTLVKNYIATYPQWNKQPGQTFTMLGMDALIRVPTVASPGPRDNNVTGFGQPSDNQSYTRLSGSALLSFLNSEGQVSTSTSTQDIIRYGTNTALNQEITFRFSTNNASDVFGLMARLTGSSAKTINAYGLVLQGNTMSMIKIINGVSNTLLYQSFSQMNGLFYRMRFSVTGSNPATLKGNIWPEGTSEPNNWMEVIVDTNAPFTQGGFGLYANAASSNPLHFDSLMGTSTNAAGMTYELAQTIMNSGSQTLLWSATSNQSWCTLSTTSGSIAVGGAAQTFTILVNVSTLTSGMHTATVTVTSNGGSFYIPVSITIP